MQGSSVDHYVSGQTSPWLAIIAEVEFGQFVSLLFSLCICFFCILNLYLYSAIVATDEFV